MREIIIDERHQGPFGAANGGYVAGILGDALGPGPSNVRIRRPVPLGTPLHIARKLDSAVLMHDDRIVASAETIDDEIPEAGFATLEEVLDGEDVDFDMGMFAECFVCGQGAPTGLGVTPRKLGEGRFAAVWRPLASNHIHGSLVEATYLRSALDCPGGFAVLSKHQTVALTGTLTSMVNFLPTVDETLIVVGEAIWAEGRKLGAVTTIFSESDEVVATASAVWIVVSPLEGAIAAA